MCPELILERLNKCTHNSSPTNLKEEKIKVVKQFVIVCGEMTMCFFPLKYPQFTNELYLKLQLYERKLWIFFLGVDALGFTNHETRI